MTSCATSSRTKTATGPRSRSRLPTSGHAACLRLSSAWTTFRRALHSSLPSTSTTSSARRWTCRASPRRSRVLSPRARAWTSQAFFRRRTEARFGRTDDRYYRMMDWIGWEPQSVTCPRIASRIGLRTHPGCVHRPRRTSTRSGGSHNRTGVRPRRSRRGWARARGRATRKGCKRLGRWGAGTMSIGRRRSSSSSRRYMHEPHPAYLTTSYVTILLGVLRIQGV